MNAATFLIPSELIDFLLNIAPIRPVFIWGPSGIGKSSLVEAFVDSAGLPCISLIHDRRIGEYYLPEGIVIPMSQNLIGRLR
jgi:MoxR-like ATPase